LNNAKASIENKNNQIEQIKVDNENLEKSIQETLNKIAQYPLNHQKDCRPRRGSLRASYSKLAPSLISSLQGQMQLECRHPKRIRKD